jgi:hypothetical protein
MPALVAGIHVFMSGRREEVDGRDKPGHDVPCSARDPAALLLVRMKIVR